MRYINCLNNISAKGTDLLGSDYQLTDDIAQASGVLVRSAAMHDMDLPEGSVRIKFSSGHGGQNGVRSIIDRVGSKSFYQVKVGIGHPPGRMPAADYVLSRPRGEAAELFESGVQRASECVLCFLKDGITKAQDLFN